MNRLVYLAYAAVAFVAEPAFAGTIVRTPAPIAGLGIGAFAVLGMGYRALKSRSSK